MRLLENLTLANGLIGKKLSVNGVGFFPEVREPIACDKQVFLAEAKRAGFNPNANAEHVLRTFRIVAGQSSQEN